MANVSVTILKVQGVKNVSRPNDHNYVVRVHDIAFNVGQTGHISPNVTLPVNNEGPGGSLQPVYLLTQSCNLGSVRTDQRLSIYINAEYSDPSGPISPIPPGPWYEVFALPPTPRVQEYITYIPVVAKVREARQLIDCTNNYTVHYAVS